jgi:hypothetical protein
LSHLPQPLDHGFLPTKDCLLGFAIAIFGIYIAVEIELSGISILKIVFVFFFNSWKVD